MAGDTEATIDYAGCLDFIDNSLLGPSQMF